MEQKRTLWILIATGVFLCVVIGAAFLFFGNSQKTNTSAMTLKDSGMIWVSPESGMQGQEASYTDFTAGPAIADANKQEEEKSPLSSPYAFTEEDNSDVQIASGEAKTDSSAEKEKLAELQTDSLTVIARGTTNVYQLPSADSAVDTTTIDLNGLKNYKATSTVTAQNQAAKDAMDKTAKESAPKYLSSSTNTSSSAKKESVKKETTTAKAIAKPATTSSSSAKSSEKVPDRFWVQVGSFSNKKNADEARKVLEEKSIKCEVFTYEDKGTLKYRLRAGNYASRTEAEYWKKQIDSIDYFAKNGGGTFIINSSAALAKK